MRTRYEYSGVKGLKLCLSMLLTLISDPLLMDLQMYRKHTRDHNFYLTCSHIVAKPCITGSSESPDFEDLPVSLDLLS
jgi:hypothetical protein